MLPICGKIASIAPASLQNLATNRYDPKVETPKSAPQGRVGNLEQLIERTLDIPTIPVVAHRVIAATSDPNSTASQLSKIVEADQGISARILRVCNSSLYGLTRKVTSLQQAITILGFRELKHLVVSASTKNLYKTFGPVEQAMWAHSTGAALASHMIAETMYPKLRELAFLAGQMHDVGKVVIKNHMPKQFEEVQKAALTRNVIDVEAEILGFSHADVGSLIMKRWNMPEAIEATAFHHHDLSLAESIAPDHIRLIACVAIANHLCHVLGIGSPVEDKPDETQIVEAMEIYSISSEQLPTLVESFQKKYEAERASFGS
jgi:HD-like signal output (HDOD) protein